MVRSHTVADIGEFGLIERIAAIVGHRGAVVGIGDDTAVIDQGGTNYLLATIDMLVEDVHFRRSSIDPFDLGRRALAVNISDIAAMGGTPTFALTSIGLQPDTPLAFMDRLYEGLRRESDRFEVGIVGGNITRTTTQLTLDVTLLGSAPKGEVLLRRGAQVGDVLGVTGLLGEASAALLVSENPNMAEREPFAAFRRDHTVPQPRVEAGRAIAGARLAHAMMDISDGLASDLQHMTRASGVGAVLYEDRLPISITARQIAEEAGRDPHDLALNGGEDYELLIALPEDALTAAREKLGQLSLYVVGTVLPADQGVQLERFGGKRAPLKPLGWTHF